MEKYEINKYLESFNDKIKELKEAINYDSLLNDVKDLEEKTSSPDIWNDKKNAEVLFSKLNDLKDILNTYNDIYNKVNDLSDLISLSQTDSSFDELIEEEINDINSNLSSFEIKTLLNQKYDDSNCIIELHPGQGGTEALDWTDMLFRMYKFYASNHNLKLKIINYEAGDVVGIKSITFMLSGKYAYGLLKGERGVHRLVRISPFDSNKRRHTTFTSVMVSPVIENDTDIIIKDEDIRIDTFMSSGAGGQGVNTTYSAVRVTHIPTGIMVTCQNERSQIKNKEEALSVLKSRLLEIKLSEQNDELNSIKGVQGQIGFGSQIRSYVFTPYTMVKDHRTNFETSQIDDVMNGKLDDFIDSYLKMKAREENEKKNN